MPEFKIRLFLSLLSFPSSVTKCRFFDKSPHTTPDTGIRVPFVTCHFTSSSRTRGNCPCFCLVSFQEVNMTGKSFLDTLKPQTNAHIFRGRPTLKDVERFWNGLVREFRERVTHFTSEFIERVTHFTSGFIERVTHFTSGFIEKLIVNFIENYTLSYELSNYSNQTAESLYDADVNQPSEECPNLLPAVYKPCESHNKAIVQGILSVTTIVAIVVLSLLVLVSIIKCNNIFFAGFLVMCGIYILIAKRSLDVHVEMYITSLFIDCDILDKTNNLTVNVHNNVVLTINITKNTRSRYSKYVYYNDRHVKLATRCERTREPSRLPSRTLKRLTTKSRKFRRFVFANIRSSVPKSGPNCIIISGVRRPVLHLQ